MKARPVMTPESLMSCPLIKTAPPGVVGARSFRSDMTPFSQRKARQLTSDGSTHETPTT
jgi:hypothetical protein